MNYNNNVLHPIIYSKPLNLWISVYITGNIPFLRNNDISKAIPLKS